jgi:hypothetical protein
MQIPSVAKHMIESKETVPLPSQPKETLHSHSKPTQHNRQKQDLSQGSSPNHFMNIPFQKELKPHDRKFPLILQ